MNITLNITADEVNIHTSEVNTPVETGINLDDLLCSDGTCRPEEEKTEDYLDDLMEDLLETVEAGELTADEEMFLGGSGNAELEVGDIVTMKFFGKPTVFRVVHKNYATDGKVVLMPEGIELFHIFNKLYSNDYTESDMRDYLNRVALRGFHPLIQNAIVETPVECFVDGEIKTVHDKLWLPSYTEVGFSGSSYAPKEGKPFDYFDTNEKRKKVGSEWEKSWWLRTPYSGSTGNAWNVNADGTANYDYTTNAYGVVPAFEI